MAGEEMVNVVDMQSSFYAKAQQEIKPTAPYAILQTAGTKKDEPIAADNLIETQETKTGEKPITAEEKIKQADEFWAQHSRGGNKVKLTVHMGKDSFIEVIKEKPNSR